MTACWSLLGEWYFRFSIPAVPDTPRPCSVHNPEQALVYCKKLLEYAKEASEDLMIVMRVYFEK